MNEVKENKHLGAYGLVVRDDKVLLIKKKTGPYDGKLDLPGGTIEFCERPEEALKREFFEEVGIVIKDYILFDANSVIVDWKWNSDKVRTHHVGIFYKINSYDNEIRKEVEIDEKNDDSLGADFYDIDKLNKDELSLIAIMELEKMGYILKKNNM